MICDLAERSLLFPIRPAAASLFQSRLTSFPRQIFLSYHSTITVDFMASADFTVAECTRPVLAVKQTQTHTQRTKITLSQRPTTGKKNNQTPGSSPSLRLICTDSPTSSLDRQLSMSLVVHCGGTTD